MKITKEHILNALVDMFVNPIPVYTNKMHNLMVKLWRKVWKFCPDCGHVTFEDHGRRICWPCLNRQIFEIQLKTPSDYALTTDR